MWVAVVMRSTSKAIGQPAEGGRDARMLRTLVWMNTAALVSLLTPLALVSLLSCASGPSRVGSEQPALWGTTVMTRFGAVRGVADADETWVWRGIPYARPPVGELRWKAPRDPEPWEGVRDARRFRSPSTQSRPLSRGAIAGSEDCLYLNVWRPRSKENGLPVYVWIHGGGNSIGSASFVPDYYGNRLASTSHMVFVSVNYRLGPMGWFAHPALVEGASHEDDSGNYGTLDLIHALKWVRDNIAAFGGDPHRVLVAGESAGAVNVLSLMTSPLARGLFTHALVESGAATTRTMEEAYASSGRVLAQLLVRDKRARTPAEAEELARGMSAEALRAFLRSRTDREILRCLTPGPTGMVGNPAILRDGIVIPRQGYRVFDSGDYAKVPMIIGSNKEESKLFLFLDAKVRRQRALYQAVARWGSERWKAEGVDGVARRLSAQPDQPPVYAYLFSWGAPDAEGNSPLPGRWGERLGAFHSLEVPFFLGTDTVNGRFVGSLLFTRKNQAGRTALSAAMMRYVASFVRNGDPNVDSGSLPHWQAWSNEPGAQKCVVLDVRGDELDIRMTDADLTPAGVDEAMKRDLPPELYPGAAAFMASSRGTVRSD